MVSLPRSENMAAPAAALLLLLLLLLLMTLMMMIREQDMRQSSVPPGETCPPLQGAAQDSSPPRVAWAGDDGRVAVCLVAGWLPACCWTIMLGLADGGVI
jgi:hypothetical protein